MNESQDENYRKAIETSRRMDLEVDYLSTFYRVEFTTACSLRCIMCAQHSTRDVARSDEVSCEALMAHVDAFSFADRFWVRGGEPLLSPEDLKFIHLLATHEKWQTYNCILSPTDCSWSGS